MEKRNKYFDEALADFVHEVASSGAIRHLVDLGYSMKQIEENLTYPEKPERIQKVAIRYMMESGILAHDLEIPGTFEKKVFPGSAITDINAFIYDKITKNGEDQSYIFLPEIRDDKLMKMSYLSKREMDYIEGILVEKSPIWHRLTQRMREIGTKLIYNGEEGVICTFLKTKEVCYIKLP